jgi:uncharacterized damage-inducible protein DinB
MTTQIYQERINKVFELYDELATFLEEASYSSKLADLPSNTIGQQLWCVIGARESYLRGIQKGKWDGFSCSLPGAMTANKEAVSLALRRSAEKAEQFIGELRSMTESQERLAFELLEHEVQHQGQLIRYLYGLKLGVPKSWKERYHLD